LIVSHAHIDHFDIPSLAKLSRDVDVLIPKDPAIAYALQKLGFKRVRQADPSTHFKFGTFEILTTLSSAPYVTEFGVAFKDKTGVFWNQIDTSLKPGTIEYTRLQLGHVDLLFSLFASQNFNFFGSMRSGYPLDITRSNLANVRQIKPGMVVPGSAGFRFHGSFAWTNPFLFPVSRERFLDDLSRVAPEIPATVANPGDVFEIDEGKVTRHSGASPLARMIEDDTHLMEFDATAPVPPLHDPNLDGHSDETLRAQISLVFDGLEQLARGALGTPDPAIEEYRRMRSSYGLGVIFPDGRERWLALEFDKPEVKITRSESRPRGIMSVHRIAASALTGWARYERSYWFYRGFSRLSQTLAGTLVNGNVAMEAREPPDLLGYYMKNKAPGAAEADFKRLDLRLAPFMAAG
jgi:hypothetical protein